MPLGCSIMVLSFSLNIQSVFATFTTQLELILLSLMLSVDSRQLQTIQTSFKLQVPFSFRHIINIINIRGICNESSHFVIFISHTCMYLIQLEKYFNLLNYYHFWFTHYWKIQVILWHRFLLPKVFVPYFTHSIQ